jgi:hypothetical protein
MRKTSPSNGRSAKRPRTAESRNDHEDSPIHVVVVAVRSPSSRPPKPISLDSANLLQDLLHPLTPQEFMTQDFRRRAVHVKGSIRLDHAENANMNSSSVGESRNRFHPIIKEGMHNLDTLELLKQTSSDSIFVWLAAPNDTQSKSRSQNDTKPMREALPKTTAYPNPLVQSIELPDAQTAFALHQAGGHALYCRAPPPVEQVLVAKLLRDTGLGCGHYDPSGESMTCLARGEVEMFVTAKAGGVTDWHYDFQENFTLQLSGVKRWTLQRGTVAHPLRACTPHYKAPDVVENQLKAAHLSNPEFLFERPTLAASANHDHDSPKNSHNAIGPPDTATLHPGDVLYFPAGMWHKIEVLEPGVSINVSLMATNFATVTCQALQHLLLQRDEWRQVVVHQPEMGDSNLNAVLHLKQLLRDLPKLIQNLEQNLGGANAILPPVLLQPPNFQVDANSQVDSADSDSGEEDDIKPPPKAPKQNDDDDDSGNDDSMDENIDKGEETPLDQIQTDASDVGDNIVDACQFEYPAGTSGPCPIDQTSALLSSHRLVCNPLASLIRMDEVKGYYSRRGGNYDNGEKQQKFLFVLNVNYAGVESHESSIRVIMRDNIEKRYMNKLHHAMPQSKHALLRNEEQAYNECKDQIAKECPNLIHCLIYYGYFALVDQKAKK